MERDRQLTSLFLRRFVENDLISPDGDRAQAIAQVCGVLVTGALFVTLMLSLGHLMRPFAMVGQTAVQVLRIQGLYVMWSMTVMALVAVSVWDALALDSRDTAILGPLPLPTRAILRAKVRALLFVVAVFTAALNIIPALMHPVFAVSRLHPTLLQVVTLVLAHLASTTAAAGFGFAAVLCVRELLRVFLRPDWFKSVSLVVQFGLSVGLMTTLLLVPVFAQRLADQGLGQRTVNAKLLPPLWFVGLHDAVSGHVWAQFPRPSLPPQFAAADQVRVTEYQDRRSVLRDLGVRGGLAVVLLLFVTATAYLWNNRRLPESINPPARRRARAATIGDALTGYLLVRRPLSRAAFSFTRRVLARSVQNRMPIAMALAVAVAFTFASLQIVGMDTLPESARHATVFFAVQLWLVAAAVVGFRHSLRIPADLRARWLFHVVRPRSHAIYLAGARRAAIAKLVVPILILLLPLHLLALGVRLGLLHSAFGLLAALLLVDGLLLGYRRVPFASSYVPNSVMTTHGGVFLLVAVSGVNFVAWLERVALGTPTGAATLFGITLTLWVIIRIVAMWQGRQNLEIELDEVVEPPTQRFGLND